MIVPLFIKTAFSWKKLLLSFWTLFTKKETWFSNDENEAFEKIHDATTNNFISTSDVSKILTFFCTADHFTACKFVCEILADCLMRGAEFDINFFKHLQRVWNVEGLLNSKVCLDCPKLSSFQRKLEQKVIGETVWKSLVNEQLL